MTFYQPVSYTQPKISVTYLVFTAELTHEHACSDTVYIVLNFLLLVCTAMKDFDFDLKLVDLDVAWTWMLLELIHVCHRLNVKSYSVINNDGKIEIPRLNHDDSIRLSEDFECMRFDCGIELFEIHRDSLWDCDSEFLTNRKSMCTRASLNRLPEICSFCWFIHSRIMLTEWSFSALRMLLWANGVVMLMTRLFLLFLKLILTGRNLWNLEFWGLF